MFNKEDTIWIEYFLFFEDASEMLYKSIGLTKDSFDKLCNRADEAVRREKSELPY